MQLFIISAQIPRLPFPKNLIVPLETQSPLQNIIWLTHFHPVPQTI